MLIRQSKEIIKSGSQPFQTQSFAFNFFSTGKLKLEF